MRRFVMQQRNWQSQRINAQQKQTAQDKMRVAVLAGGSFARCNHILP